MKINELKFDLGQFGKRMNLTGIEPYYNYEGGKKTDKIEGFKYNVVLLDMDYEKIAVKVEGARRFEEQEKYDIPVKFTGLEIGMYQDFTTKAIHLKAKATNIEPLK